MVHFNYRGIPHTQDLFLEYKDALNYFNKYSIIKWDLFKDSTTLANLSI